MEKIKISEDLCNYIESLHYESNALQELLSKINIENAEKSLQEFWYNKYIEKFTEYNVAKQELENEYIIPNFGNNHKWNLDFNTQILEVQ